MTGSKDTWNINECHFGGKLYPSRGMFETLWNMLFFRKYLRSERSFFRKYLTVFGLVYFLDFWSNEKNFLSLVLISHQFKILKEKRHSEVILQICTNLGINPLTANLAKWSNTLKQFVGCCRRIVWVCLTILWDCSLKD